MLQQRHLNRAAVGRLLDRDGLTTDWQDIADVEPLVDTWIAALRAERRRLAARGGLATRAVDTADRVIRTDALELLDRPDIPAERKIRIVRALHRMNQAFFSYARFLAALRPWIEDAAARHGRPARVLELASGSGEFTLALADLARRRGLPVEVTGSDYIPEYVAAGNAAAARRRSAATFRVVNAFQLDREPPGAWDIVFIAQSIHHFTAGQLGMMMAGAARAATTAFVGVDGRRGPFVLGFLPVFTSLSLSADLLHDAVITARRFFSEPELELIAQLAAPDAVVDVTPHHPGFSVVTLDLRK